MDAVTPKSKHDTADTHSHVVRPTGMEWKKTRFPGCEVKGLLFDKATGLVTALMKFAPGATLPDHEHVKIEQTYVLEGKLVDKEGPAQGLTVGPGEFVWREPTGTSFGGMCSRTEISSAKNEGDRRDERSAGLSKKRSGTEYSL
jgi:quercetin dioxygenase-like cupin family protein